MFIISESVTIMINVVEIERNVLLNWQECGSRSGRPFHRFLPNPNRCVRACL